MNTIGTLFQKATTAGFTLWLNFSNASFQKSVPFYVILFFCFAAPRAQSQDFLIGLKGGGNFTQAIKNDHNSNVNYMANVFDETSGQKQYLDPADNGLSWQVGLSTIFEYNRLGIAFEPALAKYQFSNQSVFLWRSLDNTFENLGILYQNTYTNHYVELPLTLRFNVLNGPVTPYVFGGGYVNILMNSHQDFKVAELDAASGSEQVRELQTRNFGSEQHFEEMIYGLTGGIGLSINLPYVRIGLDFAYRYSMNSATSLADPYSDPKITDLGHDLIDDFSLHNFQGSIGCFFPVNFSMGGGGDKSRTKYVVPYDLRRGNNGKKRRN